MQYAYVNGNDVEIATMMKWSITKEEAAFEVSNNA